MSKTFQLGLAAVLFSVCLLGCSTATPQSTTEDEKNFKGGPMPPEARAKFEASLKPDDIAKKAADAKNGPHTDTPPVAGK
jgi:hypothetical protein